MMFVSFHSNGTTPSFNDKLNILASYNASLLEFYSNGERVRFSPIEEDGCSHFVMKKSQDGDEVGRASKR